MSKIFLLLAVLLSSYLQAGRLSTDDWKKVNEVVTAFLQSAENVTLCINESGFYRADIEGTIDLPGVKKIRVNYWPDDYEPSCAAPNSIHDHSAYFESRIVRGGYTHTIYKLGDGPSPVAVDIYKCSKKDRDMRYMGKAVMNLIEEQQTFEGECYSYPVSLIHRVEHAVPGTVTINVIFEDPSNKEYVLLFPLEGTTVEEIEAFRPEAPNKEYHLKRIKQAF